MKEPAGRRPIRSFVLREGRMTRGQQRAFDTLWPRYGVDWSPGSPLDPRALFGADRPVYLEIGTGNGETLVQLAARHPGHAYLGVEVHRPGIGHLLQRAAGLGLENLRVVRGDAVALLDALPEASLAGVYLLFPDPWPKKRHHKRRILQPPLVERLVRVIRPGGLFHAATDWEEYAQQMLRLLSAEPRLENTAGPGHFTPRPDWRPLTRFEQRGRRLGHGVWDLRFRRLPA